MITSDKSVWQKLFFQGLKGKSKYELYAHYKKIGLEQFRHIEKFVLTQKIGKFLEIGCGTAMTSLEVAKRGWQVYGIDFVKPNLDHAKRYFLDNNQKIKLKLGDINKLPYPDNFFDLVYGGGVIEHVKDTSKVVSEIYRVLKPNGLVINTVPAFSLSSLTYRQLAGNIPEIPILKQFFELIHIKLLKGKLMHCGYEKSFTRSYLSTIHKKAGFKKVNVKHLRSFNPTLPHFPNKFKPVLKKLEKNRLFWAWLIVYARK